MKMVLSCSHIFKNLVEVDKEQELILFPSYKQIWNTGWRIKDQPGFCALNYRWSAPSSHKRRKSIETQYPGMGTFYLKQKRQKTVYTHIYAVSPRGMHLQPPAKDNKCLLFFHRVPFPHQKIIISWTKGSRKSSRECVIEMIRTLRDIIQ